MKHIKTFEGFLYEADVTAGMGPKAKKFTQHPKIDSQVFWFTDADGGGEEPLRDAWHTALKTLNVKEDDAIVCYFEAVGRQEALDTAKLSGITYAEVDDEDGDDSGIVFTSKQ
jgi:hypothetical protein